MNIAKGEKRIWKGYMLYDPYSVMFWKRQICGDTYRSVVARDWSL